MPKNKSDIKKSLDDLQTIIKLEKDIDRKNLIINKIITFCDTNIDNDICVKILNIIKS